MFIIQKILNKPNDQTQCPEILKRHSFWMKWVLRSHDNLFVFLAESIGFFFRGSRIFWYYCHDGTNKIGRPILVVQFPGAWNLDLYRPIANRPSLTHVMSFLFSILNWTYRLNWHLRYTTMQERFSALAT